MDNNEGQQRDRLSALDKALLVLEALADHPHALGLPDLTAIVKLPRQTVHRVLQQLEGNGLILRDRDRERYTIGPRFSRLALAALSARNQTGPVRVILGDVVGELNETCNIGILDDLDFLYLERIECDWSLRVHLQAGSRVPAHCVSGGKVMLAFLGEADRAGLLRSRRLKALTPNTIFKNADLKAELDLIRQRGYALNDQEFTDGIVGVSVPVTDVNGKVLAALAMHGPAPRLNLEQAEKAVPRLQAAAKRVAQAWGLADSARNASE